MTPVTLCTPDSCHLMQDEDRVKGHDRQNGRQRVSLHWAWAAFSLQTLWALAAAVGWTAGLVLQTSLTMVDSRFRAADQPDHGGQQV